MKVLIIGAGNMGAAFVKRLSAAGHSVRVSSRSPDKAAALAARHPGTTVAADAGDSEVVILATGFADAAPALAAAGDLKGKVVVDITNPLTPDYMGLTIGHNTSAGEQVAALVPGAEVVKAFNTVFAQVLDAGPELGGQQVPVFLASDSTRAKHAAQALAESMGFATIDAGALKNARYLEPVAGLNIYLGYGAGLGTTIAPTWLRQA